MFNMLRLGDHNIATYTTPLVVLRLFLQRNFSYLGTDFDHIAWAARYGEEALTPRHPALTTSEFLEYMLDEKQTLVQPNAEYELVTLDLIEMHLL